MTDINMSQKEMAAFLMRLKLAKYKVNEFGRDGYSVELDGSQIVRVTATGNERFAVRFDERIFPDV